MFAFAAEVLMLALRWPRRGVGGRRKFKSWVRTEDTLCPRSRVRTAHYSSDVANQKQASRIDKTNQASQRRIPSLRAELGSCDK